MSSPPRHNPIERVAAVARMRVHNLPSIASGSLRYMLSKLSHPNIPSKQTTNTQLTLCCPTAVASTVGQPECPSKPQDPIPSPPSTDHLLTNLLLSFSDSQATKIVELAVARARISVRPCFKAQIRLQASGSQLCQGSQPFPPCSLMENIKGRVV